MKPRLIISIFTLGILLYSCNPITKIACVGDSITQGVGTENESKSSYPAVLNNMLGNKYAVINCGRSGATLQQKGDRPYWKTSEFYNAFASRPSIVIIALGTNDSKDLNWVAARYESDFQALIDTLKTIPTKPKIYVCLPPPAFKMAWSISDTVISQEIIPIIKKLEQVNKFEIIDLYQPLRASAGLFPDGIHPNEAGAKMIANIIANAIKK